MPEANPRLQCRHIHSSGRRCASPSLRKELFCYFHHGSRKPIPPAELQIRRGHQSTFTLPEPEDRTAIQLAIGEVLRRIASNDLDPKRAGLLLYGLQIASSNLPREIAQQQEAVEDILLDETYGLIAPESEFQSAPREKSLEQILREQWDRDKEQDAADEAAKELKRKKNGIMGEIPPHPGTLPNLQATAGPNPTISLAPAAFASRYPKASALGLSNPTKEAGLQPLGYAFLSRPQKPRSNPNLNALKILPKIRGGSSPLSAHASNQHRRQSIQCTRIGE